MYRNTVQRPRRARLLRGGLVVVPVTVTSLAMFASASVAAKPSVTVGCASSPCSSSLIQAAIDSATTPSGATIAVGAGTYQGDLKIDKNVTLQADSGTVTIDGGNSASNLGSTVTVPGGVVAKLDGLTITGGYVDLSTQWGGGIHNDGSLTLSNGVVTANNASNVRGGAVSNDGTMNIVDSTLSQNASNYGGAIVNYAPGILTVSNTTISRNTATVGNGGGIDNEVGAHATFTDSTFSGNSAAGGGGAIDNFESTVTVSNTRIENNTAADGGGIYNFATTPAGVVNLKDDIIHSNTPDNCAGALSC